MASDTGNNNMVNNPVDAPDGRAAEAQRLPNNMASHNFYANQGKRDCLRYVLKILIMLAMLAFLIASMVGIYEIKKDVDRNMDNQYSNGMAIRTVPSIIPREHGLKARDLSSVSDSCASMTGSGATYPANSTTTETAVATRTGTITVTTIQATVTTTITAAGSTTGNSAVTTETAEAVSASCGTDCTSTTSAVTSVLPPLSQTSAASPVAASGPSLSTSTITATQVVPVTTLYTTLSSITSTTVTAYAAGTPYYSANGTYPAPTAPTASNPSVFATSAVAGVSGASPPIVSSGAVSYRLHHGKDRFLTGAVGAAMALTALAYIL